MNQDRTTQDAAPDQELVPLPMRVTRERKARWVQQSRAEGKKLTDWIVERVERCNPPSTLKNDGK